MDLTPPSPPAAADAAPPAAAKLEQIATDANAALQAMVEAAAAGRSYEWALERTLKAGAITLTKLAMRQPTAKDVADPELCLSDGRPPTYDQLFRLGARLCGQAPEVLHGLGIVDFHRVVVAAGFFSGVGRPPALNA